MLGRFGGVLNQWRRKVALGLLRPARFLPAFMFPAKVKELPNKNDPPAAKEDKNSVCPPNTYNLPYTKDQMEKAYKSGNDKKIKKWESFYKAQWLGKLSVGTRQAVKGTPTWVTLEVATGGFATGNYLAGGDLQLHELDYYKHFFGPASARDPRSDEQLREKLNREFITPRGFEYLSKLLETSKYRIRVPEEGALLTVVWLFENGHEERAQELLKTIEPWFSELRFYPVPSDTPLATGAEVSVASVARVVEQLRRVHTPEPLDLNRRILEDALPLCDELIAAVLKTTKGNRLPEIVNGKVEGDFPFKVVDEQLKAEISNIMDKINALPKDIRSTHRFSSGNLSILLSMVQQFLQGSHIAPNGWYVRKILADINKKRGLPGSPKLQELREQQKKYVKNVGVLEEMSSILVKRLTPEAKNPGVSNIDVILQPIQKAELEPRGGTRVVLHGGEPIIDRLAKKVKRAKLAPVEQLCADGLIPSAEVLAILCPAIVSSVISKGMEDRPMAALYGAIYQAFSLRRSLLLMNLESQVGISELPWFAELENVKSKERTRTKAPEEAIKVALEELIILSLKHWPETIMPNKFVDVLKDLSKRISKDVDSKGLPLMKELANDIFMGQFTKSFLMNAKIAAKMLKNTLYETYYEIDYSAIEDFATVEELEKYCGAVAGNWGHTVENGKAIETCMIVTTHNLALVFDLLKLRDKMQDVLPQLPRKIFDFVIRETRLLANVSDWHARLQMIKNAAYAFRQMVFYLSLLPKLDQAEFFVWALYRCEKIKGEEYKKRVLLPLKSLHASWQGEKETKKTIFRGFTSDDRHFLLPPQKQENVAKKI